MFNSGKEKETRGLCKQPALSATFFFLNACGEPVQLCGLTIIVYDNNNITDILRSVS